MHKLPVHTYTNLKEFDQCPRKYFGARILKKFPFQETEATRWGNLVHKNIEDYIMEQRPLDANIAMYQGKVDSIIRTWPFKVAELSLAVTAQWEPTDFWAPDAYIRGKFDLVCASPETLSAKIVDWKTSEKSSYADTWQLEIGAVLLMWNRPRLEAVEGSIEFLPVDVSVPYEMERKELPTKTEKIISVIRRVEFANVNNQWPEKPGPLCGWCPDTECPHWFDGPARKSSRRK